MPLTIPENIIIAVTAFLDGANGYASQTYVNREYGVQMLSERESRDHPFTQTWTSKRTGDQEFKSWRDLRGAMLATEEK